MKHQGARALYQYWHQAKGDQEIPARKDIQPRRLKDVLEWVFVLERIDRDLVPFRIAGTGMCDQYGEELGGTNFLSLWLGDCRRTVRSLMDNVTLMPAAAFIEFEAQAKNKSRLSGEIVLLPLTTDDGEVRQIIGGWFPTIAHDAYLERPLTRHRITNIRILTDFEPQVSTANTAAFDAPRSNIRLVISDGKAVSGG